MRNSKDRSYDDNKQGSGRSRQNNMPENNPDKLAKEADKERTRKPGSQSNSSGRHNNGRGGGK